MNLDAISRASNENTDPDQSERDFGELMANALRVCLDDLLANRGPMTDDQRKAMFARLGGGGRPAGGDRFGSEIYAKKPWWKSGKDWGGKEADEYASKGFMGKATDFLNEMASTGMMGTAMGGTGQFTASTIRTANSQAGILARGNYISRLVPLDAADVIEPLARGNAGARVTLLNKWADLSNQGLPSWKIVKKITQSIGNRAPSTLLETAVRVARTPDAALANARRPLTDEQRRAIFAKKLISRKGGGQAVVSRYDTAGGGSRPKPTYRAQVVSEPPSRRSIAAPPGGLAEAQAQNAQRLGSQPAAGRTAVPAGVGQTTAAGTWTPQGGFVPHSPEVLQAMASTRAQIAFTKQVGQQLFERALAGLKGGGEMVGIPPMPGRGDDPLVGIPQMPGRGDDPLVGIPPMPGQGGGGMVGIPPMPGNPSIAPNQSSPGAAPPVQAPAPTFQLPAIPGPVAPVPEWQPQPQPGGGSGLVGVQPAMPPATYVPPQPQPQPVPQPVPPAPDPPQQPIQQPPAPVAPAPTPPTGGGQSGGTPSWSVPGYGDPALPMMRTPSKAEPAEAAKMPQITPEMLERLRKRIAGEK